eukprot:5157677-Pyramimonas_sp.AAC.1
MEPMSCEVLKAYCSSLQCPRPDASMFKLAWELLAVSGASVRPVVQVGQEGIAIELLSPDGFIGQAPLPIARAQRVEHIVAAGRCIGDVLEMNVPGFEELRCNGLEVCLVGAHVHRAVVDDLGAEDVLELLLHSLVSLWADPLQTMSEAPEREYSIA